MIETLGVKWVSTIELVGLPLPFFFFFFFVLLLFRDSPYFLPGAMTYLPSHLTPTYIPTLEPPPSPSRLTTTRSPSTLEAPFFPNILVTDRLSYTRPHIASIEKTSSAYISWLPQFLFFFTNMFFRIHPFHTNDFKRNFSTKNSSIILRQS